MSDSFSNIQPQQTRKGLAATSLVLGIISIPTLGLLVVGAIVAIVLGAIALNEARKAPATYGGRGMAITGIITSVVSLLLIAAIVLSRLNDSSEWEGNQQPFKSLISIHNSETQFEASNLRFDTLKELAEARLIDQNYANETEVTGYYYSSTGVSDKTYCVHAVRESKATANRDFVVCEDGMIRTIESENAPQ